jgi:hypothetical protein
MTSLSDICVNGLGGSMAFCGNCGTEHSGGSFCAACGATLTIPAAQDVPKGKLGSVTGQITDDAAILEGILDNKNTSSDIVEFIAANCEPDTQVMGSVVAHPNATEKALLSCAERGPQKIREALAAKEGTSPTLQGFLARSPTARVRRSLAGNRDLCDEALEILTSDKDVEVKEKVKARAAGNIAPSLSQLLEIPADQDELRSKLEDLPWIFWHLNDAIWPQEKLLAISKVVADESFAEKIVENENTDSTVIDALVARGFEREIIGHPLAPAAVLERFIATEPEIVLSNPNTPAELLVKFSEDPSVDLQRRVARNSGTPVHVLEKLSHADEKLIVYNLVANRETPSHILERLASDPDEYVRARVSAHPHTPPEVLGKLASDSDKQTRSVVAENTNTSLNVLEKLAGDSDERVRQCVASNPNTPLVALKGLAGDSSASVRQSVATNPSTSLSLLEEFASDPDDGIRRAAMCNETLTRDFVLNKLVTP